MSEIREFKVIYRFLHHQWKPFVEISVTSVIISYILEMDQTKLEREKINTQKGEVSLYDFLNTCIRKKEDFINCAKKKIEQIANCIQICNKNKPNYSLNMNKCEDVLREFTDISKLLESWKQIYKDKKLEYSWKAFTICYGVLPYLSECFEEELGKNLEFTVTFQNYGNNIRAYGDIFPSENGTEERINASEIFSMPERINQFIKLLRHYISFDTNGTKKTQILFLS